MKHLPIVRREYLSDGSFLQQIVGAAMPGAAKLQFPFEVPEVKTSNEVVIPRETKAVLWGTVGILSAGLITAAYLRYKSNRNR